jgi:hypothetical protein
MSDIARATNRPLPTPPPRPGTLTASRLKVTAMVNAAGLAAITAPEGKPRITLRIRLPDRTITAEVAAKIIGQTMGHAFGVSDERVRSTRRRDAETWPISLSHPRSANG